jgi:cytoskeleton protein RodZ
MNESTQQTPDAEASGPLGGERLAAARRAHEISATDIAKELHLDEMKIRALEKNDFAVLGAPVFAKGHLRKYAELVGVSADDVLADYYELNRSAGAPPVVGPARKFRRDISLGPWITGGIIVVIIASTAYWWFTRGPALSFSQTDPARVASFVSDTSEPRVDDTATDSTAMGSESASEQPAEAEDLPPRKITLASAAPAVSEPEPIGEQTSGLPQVHVELIFTGECWTEVSDAAGRSLFYDLGTTGRVVSIAGDEPLQIVLGDSENVNIAVDGKDYAIPESARRGRMARLTISSQ